MSYWDTSALVKLYLAEPDSPAFLAIARTADHITTAPLTRFEARTVFLRKETNGSIAPGTGKILTQAFLYDVQTIYGEVGTNTPDLELQFERVLDACNRAVPLIPVRTLDAIHIAAALTAAESQFVTADVRQRDAAVLLGLQVFPS